LRTKFYNLTKNMNKLNVTFYVTVIVTILLMIAVVTGMLDSQAGSFYLGGAGFLILFYSARTYLILKKTDSIDNNKLKWFDKICGYVALINGFLFVAMGIILFIVSVAQLKLPSIGEIIVVVAASIYGYSMFFYTRQSLKKLG
jgi:hypothetical protein